jgi:hypothetical protein
MVDSYAARMGEKAPGKRNSGGRAVIGSKHPAGARPSVQLDSRQPSSTEVRMGRTAVLSPRESSPMISVGGRLVAFMAGLTVAF